MTPHAPGEHVPDDDERVILARIETKLDTVISTSSDHEARIRKLEKWVWLASGASAVGGGIVGHFVGIAG